MSGQIITSAAPPSPVTYGSAYNHAFTSAAPATFSVTSGALPPGLTLTPGGLLSGTLTAAGVYTATVTVSSTLGPESQTFNIVVNKAPLTITADDKSKIVGTPNPPLTPSYSGFVNGDTPASLNGALTITTTATVSSPPGAYPITPGGLSGPNYAITFIGGMLTVTGHRIYLPLAIR